MTESYLELLNRETPPDEVYKHFQKVYELEGDPKSNPTHTIFCALMTAELAKIDPDFVLDIFKSQVEYLRVGRKTSKRALLYDTREEVINRFCEFGVHPNVVTEIPRLLEIATQLTGESPEVIGKAIKAHYQQKV